MKFAVAAAERGRCGTLKKPICQSGRTTTQIDRTGAKEQAHEPAKGDARSAHIFPAVTAASWSAAGPSLIWYRWAGAAGRDARRPRSAHQTPA